MLDEFCNCGGVGDVVECVSAVVSLGAPFVLCNMEYFEI